MWLQRAYNIATNQPNLVPALSLLSEIDANQLYCIIRRHVIAGLTRVRNPHGFLVHRISLLIHHHNHVRPFSTFRIYLGHSSRPGHRVVVGQNGIQASHVHHVTWFSRIKRHPLDCEHIFLINFYRCRLNQNSYYPIYFQIGSALFFGPVVSDLCPVPFARRHSPDSATLHYSSFTCFPLLQRSTRLRFITTSATSLH